MLRARKRWISPLVAAVALAACASPALADHGAGSSATVADETIAGVEGDVARHGDPRAEFKAGADEATPAEDELTLESALPATCPIVDRTVDDNSNTPYGPAAPVIKVIYAHPVNVGNRLSTYGPVIQAGAKAITDFVSSESGGQLSMRFDIGTFEGPHCVDIQRVALPQTAAFYSSSADDAFEKVANDVYARLGPQTGPRNILIYADAVVPAGLGGVGEGLLMSPYDAPSSAAVHNSGGLFAAVFGHGGTDFFGSAVGFPTGETSRQHLELALHEVSHNLGAVQFSAPNSSLAGHCNDSYDLMCYDDGGVAGPPFEDPNCDGDLAAPPDPYGPDFQAWDCNKDDYFSVSPAPASYLDTHWNLADSAFLCDFASCAPPDRQPPQLTITREPKNKTAKRKVKIEFRVTERSAVRCQLDEREPRTCDRSFKTKVKLGRHEIEVTATDAVGLTDTSPPSVKFKVVRKRK
jgi:hypothetical protein